MLRVAVVGGGLAVAASLVAAALAARRENRRGLVLALVAALVSAAVVVVPLRLRAAAQALPPIHDVSTDLEDPPALDAVLPLRGEGANPARHGGPEVAAQQRAAYPDVAPAYLDVAPGEAFERALAAARDMGWEIVDARPERARIEATATTRWFGFRDDVVVRLRPSGPGTRVDVRSVSRVGRGDAGANAARIREYLERLGARGG
jgi:uncharacterized protein (DUF1499 family)